MYHQNKHVPVLLEQVLTYLEPKAGESYLDLTAGYGGHARVVLEQTKSPEKAVLIDRDEYAVQTLATFATQGAEVIHADFLSASSKLIKDKRRFDMILADLGISSPHIDNASRGFAISLDGPLDMRMDQRQVITAADIVNTYNQGDLRDLIWSYGEERQAGRIAQAILRARPLRTTQELAEVVTSVMPRRGKTHPATQTFQALRIAVNDELRLLEESLPIWLDLLHSGGRLVVISFHSLEDRFVKRVFAEYGGDTYDAELRILTKHPVVADSTEIAFNPRARSAKLRAVVKIKKERELTDANSRQK
jgi:16S rRNA (cytosine1402-N4)-methyltransferase